MIQQEITKSIEYNYMPYAAAVIRERAIPEIDGLKPSHRKLLYTMYQMGLLNNSRTKSANIVGQTMRLNPHGDQSIYETMVRLTNDHEALLHPYIDSKGSFGKVYSKDKYAAARYTEAKLNKICEELFKNIDKDTVDFVPNYDNSMQEPSLLPSAFPNILINPNQGIAVGMASNICSFNLNEVSEYVIAYLQDNSVSVYDYIKAPDMPTRCQIIYNEKMFKTIFETGKGSFKLRGKYIYDKENHVIKITEVPYTTTIDAIINDVVDSIKSGKIKEISNIEDSTDRVGMGINIELKRGVDPDSLMKKLFNLTQLEDTFSCNFNIIINGYPRVLGVKGILDEWIKFRIQCIKRATKFDIDKKSKQLHLLRGLEKVLLNLKHAANIVQETKEDSQVIPNLISAFDIDQKQSEYVAEIKLRNFNKQYILNRTKEIQSLVTDLERLDNILNNESEIKQIIISQLQDVIKKYGQPRKTEIIYEDETTTNAKEVIVDDYNITLFLTRDNYLKKIANTSLRGSSTHKLKDGDTIIKEIQGRNIDDILLFSNLGNTYRLKAHEVEDVKLSQLGLYLSNELKGLSKGEYIINVVSTHYDKNETVLLCYNNGYVAKVDIEAYKSSNRKLSGKFSNGILDIKNITSDIDILFLSSEGKLLIINTKTINPVGSRSSKGVRCFKMKNSELVDIVFEPKENDALIIQTEKKESVELVLDNLNYFMSETRDREGNFIYNCRQKKDKILKLIK